MVRQDIIILALQLSDLRETNSSTPAKNIKGIDAMVRSTLLNYKLDSNVTSESLSQTYQSGTKREPNPQYEQMLQAYYEVKKTYNQCQEQASTLLLAALCGGGMAAAEVALNRKPKYINEPVYSEWQYKVFHHRKKALTNISYSLIDVETGAYLQNENIEEEVLAEDDTNENANPQIGIPNDSLAIASDEEMRDEVLKKVAKSQANKLNESVKRYGYKYYLMAEKAKKEGNATNAVEHYINFIFAIPDTTDFSAKIKEAYAFLGIDKIIDSKPIPIVKTKKGDEKEINK